MAQQLGSSTNQYGNIEYSKGSNSKIMGMQIVRLVIADFQFTMGEDTTDNIVWEILLNGSIVSGSLNEAAQSGNPLQPMKMTLPAYTEVIVRATNFTGAPAQRKCYAIIQGRVYRD